jgi:hypothetical protein
MNLSVDNQRNGKHETTSTPSFLITACLLRMSIERLSSLTHLNRIPSIGSKHHPDIATNRFLASGSIHFRSGIGNDIFSTPSPTTTLLRQTIHRHRKHHPSKRIQFQFTSDESSTEHHNASHTQTPSPSLPRNNNASTSRSASATKLRLQRCRASDRDLQHPDSRLQHAATNFTSTLSLLLQHFLEAVDLRQRGKDMRRLRLHSRAWSIQPTCKPKRILPGHRRRESGGRSCSGLQSDDYVPEHTKLRNEYEH